jgi:GNAT superfamily N-acetyltransferase
MFEDMGVRDKEALDASDMIYRKWIKLALRKRTVVGWAVEFEKEVAGSGCLWLQPALPNPEGETKLLRPYLFSMFTEPEFRRKGVASSIVREAVEWCRRNGYPHVVLHGSKKGRGLYAKHGFTRTWEMRRQLKIGRVR